jgi:hypothetical protein
MATPEEIVTKVAEVLLAGGEPSDVLVPLYTDPIYIEHVPAMQMDGPMPLAGVLSGMSAEREAFGKAISDLRRESTYAAKDDSIVALQRMQGTLADGTRLDTSIRLTYLFQGGRIVRIIAGIDPSSANVLGLALASVASNLPETTREDK